MPPLPRDNFRSPAALARFFLITLVGLALDLWTKHYAFLKLPHPGQHRHTFIPGWLDFSTTVNHGAVFGLGQGQRFLFLAVSVAAIVFLTYLFAHSGRQRFYQLILGMLLAGVLGNMYDRIRFGHVRDMIHALPGWKWPGSNTEVFPWIFNVADVLLCTGVALMLFYSLFLAPHPDAAGTQTSDRAAESSSAPR
jgi:lipoprotein signal peptidase